MLFDLKKLIFVFVSILTKFHLSMNLAAFGFLMSPGTITVFSRYRVEFEKTDGALQLGFEFFHKMFSAVKIKSKPLNKDLRKKTDPILKGELVVILLNMPTIVVLQKRVNRL